MENASKALIIAGAILLSIAIIGVGMFVYNGVKDTITGAGDMTTEEIAAYNQEFTMYRGDNVRGSSVKALIERVSTHNLGAKDASELIILTTSEVAAEVPAPTDEKASGTSATDINNILKTILSGKTYKVTIAKDPDTGLVSSIGVTQNK